MGSKSDFLENGILGLVFTNVDIANIGDAAGLQNSVTAGSLYISLHTADPGDAGNQTTSEVTVGAYNTYARVAVARSGVGWTVSTNSVTNAAAITFAACVSGTGASVGWFGVGTLSAGAGALLYSGVLTPTITVTAGVTPAIPLGGLVITES